MGFLKILKKIKKQQKTYRILLLGLDNAGKTTISRKLNNEPIDDVSPTLGFTIKTIQFNDILINLWDIGGQKVIRPFWKNYFGKTEGLIWVIDTSDILRLDTCKKELFKLLIEEKLAEIHLLILANKCDIDTCVPIEDIEQYLELDKIKSTPLHIQKCSAITGEGLQQGLLWLIESINS